MKNLTIAILVVLLGVVSFKSVDLDDIKVDLGKKAEVNAVFEEYHPLIVTAFDKAEKEFIKQVDIDEVERMDPDPKKCICKGTGLLPTDGSVVSYCKYHGNRAFDEKMASLEAKIEELSKEQSKDLVIDAPILEKKLQEYLDKREALKEEAGECECTPEQAAAGECPCGEDCKCHDKSLIKEPIENEVVKDVDSKRLTRKDRPKNTVDKTHYQVIMFTAKWCGPCEAFKRGPLRDLYDAVDNLEFSRSVSADFRVLDIDDPNVKGYYQSIRNGNRELPLFVEIKNNVVTDISSSTAYKDSEGRTLPKDLSYLLNKYDLEG